MLFGPRTFYLVSLLVFFTNCWMIASSALAQELVRRDYPGFTLEIDCKVRGPVIAYYQLGSDHGNEARPSAYYYDTELDANCQQSSKSSYASDNARFPYDRGHLVPANHMDNHKETIEASNMMLNIVPQARKLNQNGGAWRKTEDLIECWRDKAYLQIWIGVRWGSDTNNDYFVNSHGIATPDEFVKLVYRPKDKKAIIWSLPNQEIVDDDLNKWVRTPEALEKVIGRTLHLPGIERTKKANLDDWPAEHCDIK